jgi:hypothetical protein
LGVFAEFEQRAAAAEEAAKVSRLSRARGKSRRPPKFQWVIFLNKAAYLLAGYLLTS